MKHKNADLSNRKQRDVGNYREPADEIELSPPFPENVRDKPLQCFRLVTVLARKFDLNLKKYRKLRKNVEIF